MDGEKLLLLENAAKDVMVSRETAACGLSRRTRGVAQLVGCNKK